MYLTILALSPILFLIILLVVFKKSSLLVAPLTLCLTIGLAMFSSWHYSPKLLPYAMAEGAIYGLWPIGIIIFGAVSLSRLILEKSSIDTMREIVSTISFDTRIITVLVAWGLESFIEAVSGFGSGLVLPISILMVMGLNPFRAGLAVLVANSVPTAYGGVGIALLTTANSSGVPLSEIMYHLGHQLFIPALFVPFLLVRLVSNSWKEVFEVAFVPLFAGLGQGLGLMLPFNPAAVAISSSLLNIAGCMFATFVFYPKLRNKEQKFQYKECLTMFFPFVLAVFLILITGPLIPGLRVFLSKFSTEISIYPGGKPLVFRWLIDSGVLLLLAGVVGSYVQGLPMKRILQVLLDTAQSLIKTIIVLVSILAMARIMAYSGMIETLSGGFAFYFGDFYPMIAPMLGTIGVLVTGSVASSGILMGNLQAEMAGKLDLAPGWLVAMNAAGSTAGKMLAPHSIAIAMAAIQKPDEELAITAVIFKILIAYLGFLMIFSYSVSTYLM